MFALDWADLVRTHQAGVWRYLRFLGCEPSEADDLTQETFLALVGSPFKESSSACTSAYLRTTARNLFLRARRAAPVPPVPESAWERFSRDDGGQAYVEALRGCVEGLDGRAREAIWRLYRDRWSHERIARELGIGREGVKTLLRRVKERLHACVERKLNDD